MDDEKTNPYVCDRCGENLLAKGVVCSGCNRLLCPVCDCAYTVDYYCYCTSCRKMVANRFAVTPSGQFVKSLQSEGKE